MQLKNISGLGTFAVEWEGEESGLTYQLSAGHGEAALFLSVRRDDGKWLSQPVVRPERFGVTGPLQRFRDFMTAARRFTEEVSSGSY